jgi:cell division septation protein DedD
MADEGFREIQLSGKQLVFLFMAAVVFSVVIFLSGVMVGRGVRPPGTVVAAASTEIPIDPTAPVQSSSSATTLNAARPPVSTQEALTYAERLEAPTPPPETLKPAAPVADPPDPPRESVPPEPPAKSRDESTAFSEPPGNGFVVQVGAHPRSTANTIARRLADQGFPAFVTARDGGLFAVRVGKYKDRREAEDIARRLKDRQYNTWVTR